jgi:hypothetical protein
MGKWAQNSELMEEAGVFLGAVSFLSLVVDGLAASLVGLLQSLWVYGDIQA